MKRLKRGGILTKEEIIAVAENGDFIYPSDMDSRSTLDAQTEREWLESKGFTVINNIDVGTNGWAITKCNIRMSTSGYIHKVKHLSPSEFIEQFLPKGVSLGKFEYEALYDGEWMVISRVNKSKKTFALSHEGGELVVPMNEIERVKPYL